MHWLDTVILCVLAGGALIGALMGFLWQMFWIISVSVGLYCSIALNDLATPVVQHYLLQESTPLFASGVAYVLVFVLVFLFLLLMTVSLNQLVRKAHLGWLNRLLGSAFVAVLLASVMGIIFLVLGSFPASRPVIEQSKIVPVLVTGIKSVVSSIPDDYRQPVQDKMEKTLQEQLKKQIGSTEVKPGPETGPDQGPEIGLDETPAEILPLADKIIQELSQPKK